MRPLKAALLMATEDLLMPARRVLDELGARVVFEQGALVNLAAALSRMAQARPDVVLVEIAELGDRLAQVFREVRAIHGPPLLVAVHTAADAERILEAMRAGACEFVYPPLEVHLKVALERVASELFGRRRQNAGGKTLGFFSAKGGCGATTIACHVAAELQRQTPQKILLADLDLEAGLVRFLMKTKSEYSVLDAAHNIHRLDEHFWRALVSNGMPRLDVIAAPAVAASAEPPQEETFQRVIRFARSLYDWIVVDLGRSLSPRTMTALEEIDQGFLVTTLEVPALYQAKQLITTLLSSGYGSDRLHVLLNRAPKRPEVTLEEVQAMLGLPVYAVLPNDYVALNEAYTGGELLEPGGGLATHFARLAAKIANLPEPRKRTKFSLLG
ncbi:MAG: AAA family ATPase [Bryobacterales bacterium]|nr:AAA family ATPase [Bryobacteraceae bacterium]MDW8131009.1 AAA family ATPase [Bryobacterales bacterium]